MRTCYCSLTLVALLAPLRLFAQDEKADSSSAPSSAIEVPDPVLEYERQRIEAILEGFMAMKNSITRERIQMEKLWKEREKQIDKVLVSTSGLYGSIKGIAGASVQDIPLLDAESEDEDPEEE